MGRRTGRSVPSGRRMVAEERYRGYMDSAAWFRRRREWVAEHEARTGIEPVCVICQAAWTLADDLHHVTYANLGHELHEDLWPMCRTCHDDLHRVLDQWARARQSRLTAHAVAFDYLRHLRLGRP